MITLQYPKNKPLKAEITLPASKSESNRMLIIRSLCNYHFAINNLSKADDTLVMKSITDNYKHHEDGFIYDCVGTGTALRFLTALFAITDGTRVLTANNELKKRPIAPLVDALKSMGADIVYLEKEGCAPIQIKGKTIIANEVTVDSTISSQFITALLLIAPALPNGLTIMFKGEKVSYAYINLSIELLRKFNIKLDTEADFIKVYEGKYDASIYENNGCTIEPDWSSAAYWYSMALLSKNCNIVLSNLNEKSIQGDAVAAALFFMLGIKTTKHVYGLQLSKATHHSMEFGFNFNDNPDLVMTIAVACLGLHIPLLVNGAGTLRHKETDRLAALQTEFKKLNTPIEIKNDNGFIIRPMLDLPIHPSIINTYKDHRIAMSFAPLAMVTDEIMIEDATVVTKSYPNFWNDLCNAGFTIK